MFETCCFDFKRVGLLKLCDTYDIVDPENGEQVGVAKEEIPGWAKLARLIVNKKLLPTTVTRCSEKGSPSAPAAMCVLNEKNNAQVSA